MASHSTREQLFSIRPDGSRAAIHPADVRGKFIRWRRVVFALLIGIYVAAPLIKIKGHPAVHLDVEARRFYLLGATFNAQDFWLVLALVTALLFALVFVTAWLGRVWCGWGCPQTVFLEGVYRPIERFFDGPRERRLKQANQPWTAERMVRLVGKHSAYLAVSLALSQVALSLFLSAKDLTLMIIDGPIAHPGPFAWSMAVTGALYFDFAWFREQLCVLACPYGRLQSAMQDRDSLIVGYDVTRGEPRGRFRKDAPKDAPAQGDCTDCNRCVQVCPTGIDIRNGLQMECLACAQCIDACDEVMIKIGKPTGLIRYDSLEGLDKKPKRVIRGRLLAYGGLMAVAATVLVLGLAFRTPFEANLLRQPGVPWVIDGEVVRNQFTLHLVNKNPSAATFHIKVKAKDESAQVTFPQPVLELQPLEGAQLPLFVSVEGFAKPFEIEVEIEDGASGSKKELEVKFLGPAGRVKPHS